MDNREELQEVFYKLVSSQNVIQFINGEEKLLSILQELGFVNERMQNLFNFIENNATEEAFNKHIEKTAYMTYIDSLEELERLMLMVDGYKEMGDINLTIAKENFHLEEEGEEITDEMVKERRESENWEK